MIDSGLDEGHEDHQVSSNTTRHAAQPTKPFGPQLPPALIPTLTTLARALLCSSYQMNRWLNPGEICNNGIDDDDNGYVDDCYGYNNADETHNLLGDGDHGIHCAGSPAFQSHP